MSHAGTCERTHFHAKSSDERESGRRSPGAERMLNTRHQSSIFSDGPMPNRYEELDGGYGVMQSRGSQRPGGYGWKVEDKKLTQAFVGEPKRRFNGIQPPVSLLVTPETSLAEKDLIMNCFVAMPGGRFNARNSYHLPFTTVSSAGGKDPNTTSSERSDIRR